MCPASRTMSSEARLKKLELPSLLERRQRGDLIEVYKILNGYEGTDYTKFFKLRKGPTRGHPWKLEKNEHFRSQVREGWFTIRVVNPWNSLPTNVVNAPSIATFKERLDEYLKLN